MCSAPSKRSLRNRERERDSFTERKSWASLCSSASPFSHSVCPLQHPSFYSFSSPPYQLHLRFSRKRLLVSQLHLRRLCLRISLLCSLLRVRAKCLLLRQNLLPCRQSPQALAHQTQMLWLVILCLTLLQWGLLCLHLPLFLWSLHHSLYFLCSPCCCCYLSPDSLVNHLETESKALLTSTSARKKKQKQCIFLVILILLYLFY